jgi:polyphosphate kinase 2
LLAAELPRSVWHYSRKSMAAHKAEHKAEKIPVADGTGEPTRLTSKEYAKELRRLQTELLRFEEWIRHQGLRIVVIFEGRDTAGKGGMIKRITAMLNPRLCQIAALPAPTERERTQWYFQRYVAHLPSAGEMVLFDRSWYNRAGVEHVMGFCTEDEYEEFMRTCPQFERMLIRSGIILIKYWLSVSDEEQERRFQARINDPRKRWKLSPMDLQARARWVDYSEAKDQMFSYTDIKEAPWYVVETDNKKSAHLNLIRHLLSLVPYESVPREHIEVPTRQKRAYERPPKALQTMVPIVYEVE